MSLRLPLSIACCAAMSVAAATAAPLPSATDSVASTFFRQRLHTGDLVAWLQGVSDHTVYEGNHQGRWSEGDQLLFSIDGNSYRQNRFYLDGVRINNRFTSGSTLYVPDMERHDLRLDTHASVLDFTTADQQCATADDGVTEAGTDYIRVTGNLGNLGGINPTTEGIIHAFHETASEAAYSPVAIDHRQHVRGAGTIDAVRTIGGLRQHLYVATGSRQLPQYDHNGILEASPLYATHYYKVQLDGQLPVRQGGWLAKAGYLCNVSGRSDGYSEFYYNRDEQPRLATYAATLHGTHRGRAGWLTAGLTWATTSQRHDHLQFARNIIDQDGESLEPWTPEGLTHELSLSARWERRLRSWLTLDGNAYNSLLVHSPFTRTWSNDVYMQHAESAAAVPLYRYDWTSATAAGALLENEVCLTTRRILAPTAVLKARLGMSVDGMLMRSNSLVTPNLVAALDLDWTPWQWLNIGVQLHHDRLTYDIETFRYMHPRYMNGDIYAAVGRDLFSQTGGRHHAFDRHLWQPSYVSFFVPIKARFGRHEIALIQGYRKFYHTWMTQFDGGADANGYYTPTPLTLDMLTDGHVGYDQTQLPTLPVYFLNPGARSYTVGYMPGGLMGKGFFGGTPYYMTQQTRYTYYGRKVEVSVSWQSMMGVGYCGLGSGPGSNNVGVLSESTANPNTFLVIKNASQYASSPVGGGTSSKGRYPAAGRYDQDRAYVARIFLSYNVNRHFQLGAIGNWTDGQPFSYYRTFTSMLPAASATAPAGQQVAIVPGCSRGINPTDGNFGCRESAIFHIDLHARAQWDARSFRRDGASSRRPIPMELYVQCYNAYDFGNSLNEFCFPQGIKEGRGPNMTLTIPRGIIASLKIGL